MEASHRDNTHMLTSTGADPAARHNMLYPAVCLILNLILLFDDGV